jgi:hypothetical protein
MFVKLSTGFTKADFRHPFDVGVYEVREARVGNTYEIAGLRDTA